MPRVVPPHPPNEVVRLVRAVLFDRGATANAAALVVTVAVAVVAVVVAVGLAAGYAGLGAAVAGLLAAVGGPAAVRRLRR